MRIKTFNNGGYITEGFSSLGGTLTGPLILSRNPIEDLEAATKQYADQNLNSFDADNIGTGTLQAGRLPAFTGDVVSNAGNANISLLNSGVSSGIYPKVTVNSKGIVVNGSGLISTDIPNLDWSKVTTGKPTTLDGYGIADAITTSGGTMNGSLVLNSDPVDPLHAVTKQYAEETINNGINFNTGDIIRLSTDVTPNGFLRCNGGEVTKVEYSVLYSVVGDTFSVTGTQAGSGKPWTQQYQINTTQNNDITGWTTGTSLPGTLYGAQAVVTKNRVYLLGGLYDGNNTSNVLTAAINSDGTLGAWTFSDNMPINSTEGQAIVTKNRVYVLSGFGNGWAGQVCTAPINIDGTLGTWSMSSSLPGFLAQSQAIITTNRVYLIGGNNSLTAYSNTVYTCVINFDGTLGSWSTGPSAPGGTRLHQAIVTKNRVYLLGGDVGVAVNNVYTAPINSDGTLGAWDQSNPLPSAVYNSKAIVTKNRVYLLGGTEAYSHIEYTYTAPINADGTLGTWSYGTSLPAGLVNSEGIVTKNRVYLLGGWNTSGNTSVVYTANISGGLNDYSPYYDGTFTPTDSNKFKLPDLSTKELQGTYSYIKV